MTQSAVPNRLSGNWRHYLLRWETFLLLVAALVFLFNSFASPYFLDPWNLSDATFNFTEKAIIALPMAMLIICREIDLSVASIIALASVSMGLAAEAGMGTGSLVAIAIAVGVACGLFNGLVVTGFGIPSIVVTIGTMSLYRGITYVILGDGAFTDYPSEFAYFGQGYVYWVFSFEFVLFLGLALVFYVLLHHTNFGRRTYAIGNNPTAALYSGIKVNKHKLILFVLVGALSGLASVLLTSRLGSTRPSIAFAWELNIVTMVVLGGVSILGGAGSILGVVIAVFLMGLVTFGLGLLNVPGIVMSIIIGAMLISVISIPVLLGRWRAMRERQS
ncbi:ABC transporter permease [Saccharospirillum sp. MSK14-1]|uniref:ABC transporter permease n=1 Tax=Saccharospirillum sp. MSK14-1 TaxID=1897632 RepID=UPI001E4E8A21|nr:ABC transporter permease [Saccharospirillum sp. MSK14-1]